MGLRRSLFHAPHPSRTHNTWVLRMDIPALQREPCTKRHPQGTWHGVKEQRAGLGRLPLHIGEMKTRDPQGSRAGQPSLYGLAEALKFAPISAEALLRHPAIATGRPLAESKRELRVWTSPEL